MVQVTKNRTRHYTAMCRPSMSLLLQWGRQHRTRLGNTRPQGHVRATFVVMAYPLREDVPHMVCREGGGVSNVEIDGNNAQQIKAIGVVISTFETLPF